MNYLKIIPAIVSFLVFAAHVFRHFGLPGAILCVGCIALVFIRKKWSVRIVQAVLILSAIEWIRSLFEYVSERQEYGMPYLRLIFILGGVALFSVFSALLFQTSSMKKRYNI